MIVPSWWAVICSHAQNHLNEHAESDVLEVNEWTGVRRLIDHLDETDTWDIYDHRGDLVLSSDGHTTRADGKPVQMSEPKAEGRYRCIVDDDLSAYRFERVDAPPTRQFVEWIATPEAAEHRVDVLVVPYDMDPNPVSIAMRLRKRIWNEEFARKQLRLTP